MIWRALLVWLALCSPAFAQIGQIPTWPPRTPAPASYTGPGDIKAFTFWGGFRAYSAATAGTKAVRIVRASDSAQQDINTLASGAFDAATATTFCNTTTCKVVTIYDKVSTNDVTQATDANRPALTANALNTSYCMTSTTGSTVMQTAGTFTANQPYSIVSLALRTAGNGVMTIDNAFAGAILEYTTSTNLVMGAGTNLAATVTGAAMHAVQAIYNGGSSVIAVDGAETPGNAGTNALVAYKLGMPGDVSGDPVISGILCDGGYVAGTISASDRTALNTNMHNAYGGF